MKTNLGNNWRTISKKALFKLFIWILKNILNKKDMT